MQPLFRDRREAGRRLALKVSPIVAGEDVVVLGLPQGGVPVAYEIAGALGAPLDVFVLRKLEVTRGVALGAIAAGGVRVLDSAAIAARGVAQGTVEEIARREAIELVGRERYYRAHRGGPKMTGRTIVLVDDGLCESSTLREAVDALSAYRPARIVVAIPVVSAAVAADVRKRRAQVVSLVETDVAENRYQDPSSVSDKEVRQLLSLAESREPDRRLAG